MTDLGFSSPLKRERLKEVNIKIIATIVVSLCKKLVGPEDPKSVSLEPPKVTPIPAPLPCCINTMNMRSKHAST